VEPFTIVEGIAAPLPAANIDTDVIMPKQFLKGVDRAGLGRGAFYDLRFDSEGDPRASFILNRPGWAPAVFLVVGPNFGCGSSREHAVWGLKQLGVQALIGTSYAGIFFDNCARNGLLALTLDQCEIQDLLVLASDPTRNRFKVDLAAQTLTTVQREISFAIDPLRKASLLQGLDSVGLTLRDRQAIRGFEADYFRSRPWLESSSADQ
jgi:3-isopropylmalate/(R)-2-methylmalate dehydratase small subunit